jgi:hypothetical protein
VLEIENVPWTTSNRTCRPASGAPAAPVTWTVAVPSWPEHRSAPDAPQFGLPAIVIDAGNSNAGLTVTAAVVVWPDASRTVSVTGVSAPTLPGTMTSVFSDVVPATATAAWSLDSTV